VKRRVTAKERTARQALARTHAYVPCEECMSGWTFAWAGLVRCRCWWAHQAKIADLLAQHARGGTPERPRV
jgi:hypothetical protein